MYVNGGSIIALGVVFPVLGTLAVAARFLARYKCRAELGADDWLCIPALATVILVGALFIWGSVKHTIGYHSTPAPTLEAFLYDHDAQHSLISKFQYAICMLSTIGTGFIRLSFMFLYRRVFRGQLFNIISWGMIAIITAWTLAFIIAKLSFCGADLSAFWTDRVIDFAERCPTALRVLGAEGISCFVLDMFVLATPCFWIWRLQIQPSQKWAVSSVFLVGLFTVAASAVRMAASIGTLHYKWGVRQSMLGFTALNDGTGWVSVLLFWQYIEHGTGMVVCCLPSVRPLLSNGRVFNIFRSMQSLAFRSWSDAYKSYGGLSSKSQSEAGEEFFGSHGATTLTANAREQKSPV